MRSLRRPRLLFMLAVSFFLITFAAPAHAIQYGDSCYKCRWIYNPWNYSTTYFCGSPDAGSWGNMQCTITWSGVCYTEGYSCYYIEVTPR